MIQHHEKRIVKCAPETMFNTILDVESYPKFVFGCRYVQIRSRGENQLVVDQRFRLGPISLSFASRAVYHHSEEVIIQAIDGPFRALEVSWKLAQSGSSECAVELNMQVDFSTFLLRRMISPLLSVSSRNIISLFEQRARFNTLNERS
ncbi:MAG: type II toxin-antitoxin system RatA family toxin [Methylococcales bacterium]|jgi:coenzyme Q-binding protein COQ10|nr:type II toxin-antitoxin system RatA family toxin [Methylococcales bacterium]MBT7442597.1 type II toxin-antitoxin system RatA family toxin [Methylococcales bacterium]